MFLFLLGRSAEISPSLKVGVFDMKSVSLSCMELIADSKVDNMFCCINTYSLSQYLNIYI